MKKVKIDLSRLPSQNKPPRTQIRVFVTKTMKFRAEIREPGEPKYEVTVNGQEWKKGKGARYWVSIYQKCRKILASLESELL